MLSAYVPHLRSDYVKATVAERRPWSSAEKKADKATATCSASEDMVDKNESSG